jgi:hypothetical protein
MTDTVIAAGAMPKVFENLEAPWDWVNLTRRIKLRTILSRPELPWDWVYLTRRIERQTNLSRPELPWDWLDIQTQKWRRLGKGERELMTKLIKKQKAEAMSVHSTLRTIFSRPELPWDWVYLTRRIELRTILKWPELPWDWVWLYYNEPASYFVHWSGGIERVRGSVLPEHIRYLIRERKYCIYKNI